MYWTVNKPWKIWMGGGTKMRVVEESYIYADARHMSGLLVLSYWQSAQSIKRQLVRVQQMTAITRCNTNKYQHTKHSRPERKKKKEKKERKNILPRVGFEPGPFWWLSVTLTITLTGLGYTKKKRNYNFWSLLLFHFYFYYFFYEMKLNLIHFYSFKIDWNVFFFWLWLYYIGSLIGKGSQPVTVWINRE